MRAASLRRARWVAHPNGLDAPPAMRDWLTTPGSLTARLVASSHAFRVQRLRQAGSLCLADEAQAVGLARPGRVREREVLLRCDGKAVVYGHTVVPLDATTHDWPQFSALGERSLGSTLFHDPLVRRGALEFARLRPGHPLVTRVREALGTGNDTEADGAPSVYYARRCVYRRRQGLLLVTEVFLPAVLDLAAALKTTNHR